MKVVYVDYQYLLNNGTTILPFSPCFPPFLLNQFLYGAMLIWLYRAGQKYLPIDGCGYREEGVSAKSHKEMWDSLSPSSHYHHPRLPLFGSRPLCRHQGEG